MKIKIFKKIKKGVKRLLLAVRSIFINEKNKNVSQTVYESINLNFKNLSPYSELSVYKTVFLLSFITIFLVVIFYFTYIDFKYNITRNEIIKRMEPVEIIVDNPINSPLSENYKSIVYVVKSKDTLSNILTDKIKISQSEAYNCINELKKAYNISNLKVGQKINIKYEEEMVSDKSNVHNNIVLNELKISDEGNLREIFVFRDKNGVYTSKVNKLELSTSYDRYIIKITNSMYVDAIQAGVPAEIVMNLINYYSFDIDFQRDIKKNDWFEVVFEASYNETGKNVKNGNIIYANLHANNSDHKIYRFEHNGVDSYFDENGLSTQKSLLKTPIDGARISSGYSKSRKHPVLGYTRAHEGVDFAAPVGTPFYAAGSGTVEKVTVGCKNGDKQCGGGFGNYILIKHNASFSTEYAHISRIATNIRTGTKVKQGQTIAYVGTTGLSTGPHLHYGVIYKGSRINPSTIKSIPLTKLSGKNLLDFLEEKEKINMLRSSATNQNVVLPF
jgi:murein DD-endopeptidase MepM/ murein hydrolase activator NlpD